MGGKKEEEEEGEKKQKEERWLVVVKEWNGIKVEIFSQLLVFYSRVTEFRGVIVLGILMMIRII